MGDLYYFYLKQQPLLKNPVTAGGYATFMLITITFMLYRYDIYFPYYWSSLLNQGRMQE